MTERDGRQGSLDLVQITLTVGEASELAEVVGRLSKLFSSGPLQKLTRESLAGADPNEAPPAHHEAHRLRELARRVYYQLPRPPAPSLQFLED